MTEQQEAELYPNSSPYPTFELRTGGVEATARVEGGAFTVLVGSQARVIKVDSFSYHPYLKLRNSLIKDGVLAPSETPDVLTYTRNCPFDSSSAAAAVTLGHAASGPNVWRVARGGDQAGMTYGAWVESNRANVALSLVAEEPEAVGTAWRPFFQALATELLGYEDRQPELVQVLQDAGVHVQHDEGEALSVMDPFSFFSLLLKHQSVARLAELMANVGAALGIPEKAPTAFTGVP